MSIRRIIISTLVPSIVSKVFRDVSNPISPEEKLWRKRAERMTLDALGHTNLTMKPRQHNEAVRYARRWYRGFFSAHPELDEVDNPEATFNSAGLVSFKQVRDAILAVKPFIFPEKRR